MEYRKIAQPDEALCAFCRRQKTYYALARQQVTPEYIAMDFQAPPGFSKDRHSHYEIFQDGAMIAYLDYYDGYRYSMRHDERSLWIGLFLVEEHLQRRHIGRSIIQQLCAAHPHHERIQLACYADNGRGLAFWKAMDFHAIDRSFQEGRELIVMEHMLSGARANPLPETT